MDNWLTSIITAIASSGITYFFTRRKNNAEARGNEIDNVERALKVYREMLTDLETRLDRQAETIQKQEKEIEELRNIILTFKKQKPC